MSSSSRSSAQRFTIERLRPGTPCVEVFEAYNEFMREHGRPEEWRIHAHGQGNLVERPLIRFDETMRIQAEMNFAGHPSYLIDGFQSWTATTGWSVRTDPESGSTASPKGSSSASR